MRFASAPPCEPANTLYGLASINIVSEFLSKKFNSFG